LTFENTKDNLLKVFSVTKSGLEYNIKEMHSMNIIDAEAVKDPQFKCDFR